MKIKDVNKGDVLAFVANDGNYKALICTSTYKEVSPYYFTFAATTINKSELPTLEEIRNSEFFGIGNRKHDYFKYSESELKDMWSIHPEIKPYYLGSYGFVIWRKDFMKFRESFSLLGNLDIFDHIDKNGNGSMNASHIPYLREFFSDNISEVLRIRGQKSYKIMAVMRG